MTGVFDLVGRNLKLTTKDDIAPYLEELEKIDPLIEVHLGGNTLGVGACEALAAVLATKKSLRVADFADIFTGRLISEIPDALRALCDALVDHEQLVEINLSDNAFGGRSAEPMVNFLTHNHHFSVLKLSNNGLGVTGGTIVARALKAAAEELRAREQKSQLRTVICGRNRLENGSAQEWADAFAAHGALVEVRLFQNGIRMEGIAALCKGLTECASLEVLDLQDNTATLQGSRAIAESLPHWPQLRVLNLSDCLLKPKGGALLFRALAEGHTPTLSALHVQYCDLDREALGSLATAIERHLKQLETLEINGNWAAEDDEAITRISSSLDKWGNGDALDELDEMCVPRGRALLTCRDPEGEDDDEEDEDEEDAEDAEAERKLDGLVRKDERAENAEPTKAPADDADKEADALADELAGTHITK